MSFEKFQDGRHDGHLGYQNGTILAILNLYVTPMPPIKFQLNPTKFKTRCRLKNFKMAAWRPSWISERNHFSNSESLSHSAASHQASAQSNLQFGRRCRLKEFQDGDHLGYRNGTILAIQNLYVAPMPLIKFRLNPTYALGGDVVWRISRWPPWLYLGYWNGMILAILNLHVARMPIIKFGLILT